MDGRHQPDVCFVYVSVLSCFSKPLQSRKLKSLEQNCALYLADTMTASPSLHLRPGSRFRHCLDRKKSPGKNTEPAAKMDNMIVDGLGQLTQRSQSTRTVLERLLSFPLL